VAEYDVFISYRWVSPDKEWVRGALFPALQAAGLRPFLDVEDFVPGRDVLLEMERAGQASRHALCVLSPDYFSEERFVTFEALNARRSDPSGRQSKLVPLLLRPATLPEWIGGLVPVDWTDPGAHKREWSKLLRLLHAPNVEAPPPSSIDQPTVPPRAVTSHHTRPATTWKPNMVIMKVNPRVVRPYAIYAITLIVASALALAIPSLWQQSQFLMRFVNRESLAKATPMVWQSFGCSAGGIFVLATMMAGFNMQIVFSMVKMFFLLAFFSFLCAVVMMLPYRSMIPHMLLALLLIAAFIKHFVLGSLGYYWKRRSLGDTAAEALLLIAFVSLMAGPLLAAF